MYNRLQCRTCPGPKRNEEGGGRRGRQKREREKREEEGEGGG
jgi:hypothetical protein